MAILNEIAQFIGLTEKVSPKCRKSLLWQRARDELLRQAVHSDLQARCVDESDGVEEDLEFAHLPDLCTASQKR